VYVGAPRPSMRMNIPPRKYANQIELDTSICDTSNDFEEVRHDALIKKKDV
jgi:hypothetical protein